MPLGFTLGAIGAIGGGAIAAGGGAESAAQTQANAALNAQNIQQGMFNTQMTEPAALPAGGLWCDQSAQLPDGNRSTVGL